MSWRMFRNLAAIVAALQLGACINSDYDLSPILKSETPIKSGTYAKIDGSTVVTVRRDGDSYRIYNRSTKLTTFARLYKIPDYSDYLLQYYDRKKNPIVYLFLKPTQTGFDIYDVEKLATTAPEHVKKLLKPISESDQKENTVSVADGKRDTFYVIREVLRANPTMFVTESYVRRP